MSWVIPKFLWMLLAHALADTVLQPRWIQLHKHRVDAPRAWVYGLGAHGLIHGALVALITRSLWLGFAETLAHAAIDFGRGERWYGTWIDQGLHVASKALWATLLWHAGI